MKYTAYSIFLLLFSATSALAHIPVDPAHLTPIENVGSSLAYPTAIHVEVTKDTTHVSGIIKRRGHKHVRIRGHVKVDLLDNNGQIVGMITAKILRSTGTARSNRYVRFAVQIPISAMKFTSVRVSHIRKINRS